MDEKEKLRQEARARILGVSLPEEVKSQPQTYIADTRDDEIIRLRKQVENLTKQVTSLLNYSHSKKHLVEFDDKLKEIRKIIN